MSTARAAALTPSDKAETMQTLAVKLGPGRPGDIPESAAWGVSPIDTYFKERHLWVHRNKESLLDAPAGS